VSVTIRLARIGKKNSPTYKVVVSNTRDKRNGRPVEILGNYNPALKEKSLTIDKEKLAAWKAKGALVTDAVTSLLAGNYTYVKYSPNAKKE